MTDRELLELAALGGLGRTGIHGQHIHMVERGWNPLEDDGAALRLAIKLRMRILIEVTEVIVIAGDESKFKIRERFRAVDDGEYAATRRAITCAAAEIGRTMKDG